MQSKATTNGKTIGQWLPRWYHVIAGIVLALIAIGSIYGRMIYKVNTIEARAEENSQNIKDIKKDVNGIGTDIREINTKLEYITKKLDS